MNNRQAGRRRGRGGQQQRSQGGPGGRDNGNRIDNRARGNAAQLLEKYKNLASDAQRQGDRVNAEYYHQFADHYFRVLNESRARFEEQNRRQRDDQDDEMEFDDEQDEGQSAPQSRPERSERQERGERPERGERQERGERPERGERAERGDRAPRAEREPRGGRSDQPRIDRGDRNDPSRNDRRPASNDDTDGVAEIAADAPSGDSVDEAPTPRRRGRPRRDAQPQRQDAAADAGDGGSSMDADRLPPALVSESSEEPKPRRRRRVTGEDASAA